MILSQTTYLKELSALLTETAAKHRVDSAAGLTLANSRFLVAYSGGLDSHVLLHLMSKIMQTLDVKVRAVHVHHGLQLAADAWPDHCIKTADALGIACIVDYITEKPAAGDSIEAFARRQRYAIFRNKLAQDEILLSAHHQQDQVETFLLQLFRGAGVKGLSGMPRMKRFAKGWHARPLLCHSKDDLKRYARENALDYIQDPSNQAVRFERNYLRNSLLPTLRERWPGIDRSLTRALKLQAETQQMLDQLAAELLEKLPAEAADSEKLPVDALLQLPSEQQRLVLRYWISQFGFSLPSEKKLHHVISDVLESKADRSPKVSWAEVEIRRFRGYVYLMRRLKPHDISQVIRWSSLQPLYLADLDITLEPEMLTGLLQAPGDTVTVRFRRGGERVFLPQKGHHVSLKKLFQSAGVPPWKRSRIPLIYSGEKLIKVVGLT